MWFCFFLQNFALVEHKSRGCCQKRFSMWQPSAISNLLNFDALSCDRLLEQNLRWYTKFHWNRIIPGRFINHFQNGGCTPSWIFFSNLVFWSFGLCLNAILLLPTKFCVNRAIDGSDIAKNDLQCGTVRHFEFAKFWYFVALLSLQQNLRLHTKVYWNRMIPGWEIAIKPFSKWPQSAI